MKCPKCYSDNPDISCFCSHCGTQLRVNDETSASLTATIQTPLSELAPGTTFAGRYQTIEELGKGGMGKVYKVIDTEIREKVALKLLNPEISADKRTIERFRNELKMARRISHKNVCRMYHLGKEEGIHYITMEYVPGEDLKSFIRRSGQLTVEKAVSLARQICEGLAEAHKFGVVHRDLKPRNIMIDREGNARIMDFGIARTLKAKGITDTGVMIGTPEYMSPEQVEGKEADQRSDIYSFGVILFEMVTGRIPFEGDTPLSIAVKHKVEKPPDPKKLNAQVTMDLRRVILKCMEKNKERRYQNAQELFFELTEIEKELPTTEKITPRRKPMTSREITVTLGLKNILFPALIFIILVIIGVIIWRFIPQGEAVSVPLGRPSLTVMYFENNTGDGSLDYWRKALSDLLIADLSQSKYLKVLTGERLFEILSQLNLLEAKSYSSDVLKEVASRGRTGHVLVGDYAKAGDVFRIHVMLQEANTGELVGSENVEGRGEESIFSMVDELTKRIKTNFKFSSGEIASDIDNDVSKITTSSPEAFRYYSEAERYFNQGDYRLSIELFKRAIGVDRQFAMAFSSMGRAYGNLGYDSQYKRYILRAIELKDRVSDKERYRIEVEFYRQSEKTWDRAIEAHRNLLMLYPEDEFANFNLGVLYMYLEQWDKAIERFEVNRKNKVETFFTYVNLARTFMAKGMYDKAKEVLKSYLENFSDNAIIHFYLADNYLCQGKYDLALTEANKAFALNPALYRNFIIKGDIYHAQGDLNAAEKEYRRLLEAEEKAAHLYGRDRLGSLYLLQGKFEDAKHQAKLGIDLAEEIEEKEWIVGFYLDLAYRYLKSNVLTAILDVCNEAREIAGKEDNISLQKLALHYQGLAYLEMDSIEEAQRIAEELNGVIQKGMNEKEMRYYHHLKGSIAFKINNFREAIGHFKKAISFLPYQYPWIPRNNHALFFESLASAYYRAGDLESAQNEYEKIISLSAGRLNYGDIYAKTFYKLGKIYEERGWKKKAIEHYEKFLDLWKDANANLPEITDAEKRILALPK